MPAMNIAAPPLALMQSPQMMRTLRALGRDARIVPLDDAGQVAVIQRRVGPVSVRFASRGPVFDPHTSTGQRIAALKALRLHVLNANGGTEPMCHAAGFRQVMTPATVAILPLCSDRDAQLVQTRGKWRNAARQAQRSGLVIRQAALRADSHNWLFDVDRAMARARGYRNLPAAVVTAYATSNPGLAQLFTAHIGAVPVAAMLMLLHGTTATYQIGWSDTAGRRHSAHHALLLHAADALRACGVLQLDLGTLDTINSPGLARFKLGCGAQALRLGGTWIRLPFH
ncbi:GNAT family N-acetyltransferase [Loktanella sp. SALINAS62]|uniref:GNAT family N-acetyltransferase n=1 Tax=Loktanella sp. SALINAS62 TaxID=2706124 RepID=UPI001B8C7752|nr:GNAT family N-acetyltransferase [Loktanella sp. SALINAS62]MBS1303712.1 GNAT family N-acetyltransferase [Loktanella sp. SALINAS62]